MKRYFLIVLFVISLVVSFGTLSFGQAPDISGDWLFDLSGVFRGGAVVTIDADGNFEGYGLGILSGNDDANGVLLSGQITVDEKRKIKGTYTAIDAEDNFTIISQGNLTGSVDKKISKLSLKLENGPKGKAIKLPISEPDIPSSWSATFKGKQATMALTIEQITYDDNLDLDLPYRVYKISGLGSTKDGYDISIEGQFFLNSKNMAYGWYEVREGAFDSLFEEGFFSGKMNLKPDKSSFSMKLTGYNYYYGAMSKGALKGTAV
jgi:hypothetical protein